MAYYSDAHIAGTLGGSWFQLNPTQQAQYIARFREEQAGDAFAAANPTLYTAQAQTVLTPSQKVQVAELARTDPSAYVPGAAVTVLPPLPHPDASDLTLGPNLGGQDAVVDSPGTTSAGTTTGTGAGSGASSGLGGLLLVGGGLLVALLLLKKK